MSGPLSLQYSLFPAYPFREEFFVSKMTKDTENNHLGRLYLGVTHATVNSTVQTLTEEKAHLCWQNDSELIEKWVTHLAKTTVL